MTTWRRLPIPAAAAVLVASMGSLGRDLLASGQAAALLTAPG
ncbi:hypothetical protein [Aestuariimicrobium ganziense]|nr:hypothetical protein [Aestuariimicrobium ganziense]